MVVLIRARGIDLLITPFAVEEMLNSNRKLSISMHRPGDVFVEYHYTGSDAPIHWNALSVALLFVARQPINKAYFQSVGIGRSEWAGRHGDKAKAHERVREEGSLSELYQVLSDSDGESVYLGDGVWLGPGGSLKDEG
jgi:hypothetical protein